MRRTAITSGRAQQRGAAMVIVTIGMLGVLAMTGLALDMGDVYVNKTRLQNALDAAALSAAKDLSLGGDLGSATMTARATFDRNTNEGNGTLAEISDADIAVEVSDSLVPWIPNSGTRFVRVSVDTFTRDSVLISVLGIDEKPVRASATAGPQPVGGEGCARALPILACGDPAAGSPHYGYTPGDQVTLKLPAPGGSCDEDENGPGNFGFLQAEIGDGGADGIRRALCGVDGLSCIGEGFTDTTKPGGTVATAQGLNTRFGDYHGPPYINPDSCPADTNVTEYMNPPTDPPFYESHYLAEQPEPPAERRFRRVVPIPIGECTCQGGNKQVTVLGVSCFLLTEKFEQSGHGSIKGEFLGENVDCLTGGEPDPDPAVTGGTVRIILYKDQVKPDA